METKQEVLSKNLTASGYGANYKTILDILNRLTEEEIILLTYNLYRTSEKLGQDAFDCIDEYEY